MLNRIPQKEYVRESLPKRFRYFIKSESSKGNLLCRIIWAERENVAIFVLEFGSQKYQKV
jgi:hypothetical protein